MKSKGGTLDYSCAKCDSERFKIFEIKIKIDTFDNFLNRILDVLKIITLWIIIFVCTKMIPTLVFSALGRVWGPKGQILSFICQNIYREKEISNVIFVKKLFIIEGKNSLTKKRMKKLLININANFVLLKLIHIPLFLIITVVKIMNKFEE